MKIPDTTQPYMLSYTAEGATEKARPGLSIAYVVGHELGHASTNRLLALARGQEVQQEIDYRVEVKGGRLVATGGVTRATFTEGRGRSGSRSGLPAYFAEAPDRAPLSASLPVSPLRELESLKAAKKELERELFASLRASSRANSLSRRFRPGGPDASSSGPPSEQERGTGAFPEEAAAGTFSDAGAEGSSGKAVSPAGSGEEGLSREVRRLDNAIRELKYRFGMMTAPLPLSSGEKRREEPSPEQQEGAGQETRLKSALFSGAVDLIRREVPPVVLIDDFGSALRVQSAVDALRALRERNEPVLAKRLRFQPAFGENRLEDWNRLKDLLGEVERFNALLLGSEGLNTKKASSSDESVLTAAATSGSSEGSYSVLVERRATQHRVASDAFSDTSAALGLSGTITLNDFAVSLDAADSLRTLADKINWGEDVNRNAVLDYGPERDVNGNRIAENGEDDNGNGMLDTAEDLNFDRKLTGGAGQHGVSASLADGRLILTSSATGRAIRFKDDEGILKRLGILSYDTYPLQVTVKNELQAAVKSRAVIDGTSYEQESNELTEAIPGLSLSLHQVSSSAVTVSVASSADAAVANIKGLVSAYNRALEFLNDRIRFVRTFSRDKTAQRLRVELKHTVTDPVTEAGGGQSSGPGSLSDIGVSASAAGMNALPELSLLNLYSSIKDGLQQEISLPSQGSRSLYARIDDLGIRTKEDDSLSVDEEKLASLLREDGAGMARLFTGNGGISVRLKEQLARDLDAGIGTIALQRAALGGAEGTFEYFQRLQKFNEVFDSLNRRERLITSTFSVIA
ncbi:MAG: flagellar filament capping protein FliD [Thermodesulfovibrionales bacterium]